MKALYMFLALVFVAFALLQLNDPDPIHWTLGYLAVAVSCGLAASGRFPKWWLWGVTAVMGLWTLSATPGIVHWARAGFPDIAEHMQAGKPLIEETREFLGLLMATGTMLFLSLVKPRR